MNLYFFIKNKLINCRAFLAAFLALICLESCLKKDQFLQKFSMDPKYVREQNIWRTPFVNIPNDYSEELFSSFLNEVNEVETTTDFIRIIFPEKYSLSNEESLKFISKILTFKSLSIIILDITNLEDSSLNQISRFWASNIVTKNKKIDIAIGSHAPNMFHFKVKKLIEDKLFPTEIKGIYLTNTATSFLKDNAFTNYLMKNKNLRLLNLENNGIGLNKSDDINDLLLAIKGLKKLEYLTIANNWLNMNPELLKSFNYSLSQLKFLKYLNLSKNGLGIASDKLITTSILTNIGNLSDLEYLNLESNWIGGEDNYFFFTLNRSIKKLKKLNSINLNDNLIGELNIQNKITLSKTVYELPKIKLIGIKNNADFDCLSYFQNLKNQNKCLN